MIFFTFFLKNFFHPYF